SPIIFAEAIVNARFDIADVYSRVQKQQLGHLMFISAQTMILISPDKQGYVMEQLEAILQLDSIDSDERMLALGQLNHHYNDPLKAITFAEKAIRSYRQNTHEFNMVVTTFVLNAKDEAIKQDGETFTIYTACVKALSGLRQMDFDLVVQLMQKAGELAPDKKTELITLFFNLANVSKDNQKIFFIEQAIKFSDALKIFCTTNEYNLSGQIQRLIDHHELYKKTHWYKDDSEYTLTQYLFENSKEYTRLTETAKLIDQNKIEDSRAWMFIQLLCKLLIQNNELKDENFDTLVDGLNKYYPKERSEENKGKIIQLLKDLSEELKLTYIKDEIENYLKRKAQLRSPPVASLRGSSEHSLHDFLPLENDSFLITPEDDSVLLAASSPGFVKKGDEFTARFVAYIKSLEKEIESTLQKMSPHSNFHKGPNKYKWENGTKIKVVLHGKYLKVTPTEDYFTWEGSVNMLDFDVQVVEDAPETTTILKFDVFISEFIIAKIRIDLDIVDEVSDASRKKVTIKPIRKAFASYASEDRQRVLDRVSEIQRNSVDIFMDCLSLHPGEEWKARLQDQILSTESFLLFWSPSAKESKWVDWEWRTALQYKGIEIIEPHPLCPVKDALPPEELKELHFGDINMLVRKAYDK
ncbi:MAG: toll/interleukin-1 receptor domain-containing protein, partial [Ginsengibacter sp.]